MHASLVTIALALITAVAVRLPAAAQNWPRFRGPAGSGVVDTLMATPAITDGIMIVRGQQHLFAVK